jgi:hypothetical protein
MQCTLEKIFLVREQMMEAYANVSMCQEKTNSYLYCAGFRVKKTLRLFQNL